MVFSSSVFLTLFLPLVLLLYLVIRERYRTVWLVSASLFFYAWGEPKAVLCMIGMILVNYGIGQFLHTEKESETLKAGGGGKAPQRLTTKVSVYL